MPKLLQIFLLSATPLIEQRGAIPLGFIYGLPAPIIFITSLIGSLLPALPILFLVEKIYLISQKNPTLKPIHRFIDKKIIKHAHKFSRYQELALITFVAIPLPTTGIWTGALLAGILKFNRKKALLALFLGATLSAAIITALCLVRI